MKTARKQRIHETKNTRNRGIQDIIPQIHGAQHLYSVKCNKRNIFRMEILNTNLRENSSMLSKCKGDEPNILLNNPRILKDN